MPVYSSSGQIISPSDPNYAVYAAQNNPAPQGSSSPTTTAPKVIYNPDGTRSVVDNYWDTHNPTDSSAFDAAQKQTKSTYAKMLQDRIDSINAMYESIISRANETGRDKLGSGNVINALSGQRGSASGARTIDDINSKNNEILQSILAEKQNKINAAFNENYKDQSAELEKQNDLRREDLDKYLAYMGQKEKDNLTKSEKMRADLIGHGIKIEDISDDMIQKMAEAAGYTPDQFKSLYNVELDKNNKTFTDTEQKRLLDLKKTESEINKNNSDTINKNATFEKDLTKSGWQYVKTPKERDDLKKQGYDISEINGRTYAKPSKTLEYEQKKMIDSKYKAPKSPKPKSNYTETTIPKELKSEILTNIKAGAKYDDVLSTYPEVNANVIKGYFNKPKSSERSF